MKNAASTRSRGLALASPVVEQERTSDGGVILRTPVALAPYERSVGELLRRWGREDPARPYIAERTSANDGWRRLSYGEANAAAESIAQALLDRGLSNERPVLILSGNSVDHALLMLGGFLSGVPVAPVSVAYSLLSDDFAKLRQIVALVRPGMVFAQDATEFARALESVDFGDAEIIASRGELDHREVVPFSDLLATHATVQVEQTLAALVPDSVAKLLFTSGSTGVPKGVITTHRMLCSNQQAIAQIWPFAARTPPILVDWLPWSHTFGGNQSFNLVLKHGGTLYIDGGRPTQAAFAQTVANLTDVSPTMLFNVPAGYAQLATHLEADPRLRSSVFERLQMIFYAGAALTEDVWRRLDRIAVETCGEPVFMTSSWGLTETAPCCTSAHFHVDHTGNIGVPIPGVEVKLVPAAGRFELRVKGPNVTPGYLGRADLTAAAFDDDGWYRTGDAGRLADPAVPAKGLFFNGRVAEDFKLSSGTFVRVTALRTRVLTTTSPALQDLTVAGHDRDYIAVLAWPSLAGVRQLCGEDAAADLAAAAASDELRDYLRERLAMMNAAAPGSSMSVRRLILLEEPPSPDANEITDKGYINQRAVLERRADLVEALYAARPGPDVIVID